MYTNRLHTLSARRKEQQKEIDLLTAQVTQLTQTIDNTYKQVKEMEENIEKRIHALFGNETEGVSFYMDYTQVKQV